MDINSISGNAYVQNVGSVGANGAQDPTPAPANGFGPATQSSLSGPGRFLQQLKDLQSSDPAKFAQVTSDMAKSLRADAQKESGGAAQHLNELADRLDKVAQSGDLSELAPSGQPPAGANGPTANGGRHGHHGHHGHHGGGGSAIGADVQKALSDALASYGATATTSNTPSTSAGGTTDSSAADSSSSGASAT